MLYLVCCVLLRVAWAERLAVLDFDSAIEGDIVEILSDQSRAAALDVLDPVTYSIITRENMMKILGDMGKDASCISGSCEVEIAQNIGADFVVSGSVHLIDTIYVATLKLHESSSGTLLAMEKVQSESKVELIDATFDGTRRLIMRGFSLDSEQIWLTVITKPAARLYLDGELLCENTPCRRQVEVGRYEMRLESEAYTSFVEIIEIDKSMEISRQLVVSNARVKIVGIPDGIALGLDGVGWKKTPIWEEIEAGSHSISVIDRCYTGESVSFQLKEAEHKDIFVQAEPITTKLKIQAIAPNGKNTEGTVYVDGEYAGSTQEVIEVPLCAQQVEVRANELRWSGRLSLRDGKLNRHRVELRTAKRTSKQYPMITIDSGRFWMGSASGERGRNRDEEQHQVYLTQSYEMGVSEVTQAMWLSIMGENPAQNKKCGRNCPVDNISWCDAVIFANALSEQEGLKKAYEFPLGFGLNLSTQECNKLAPMVYVEHSAEGYRLPTEAEWEYAARSIPIKAIQNGNPRVVIENRERYASGNIANDVAWFVENSSNRSHPVCQKERSELELCDISGNVFEWTGDWYEPDTSNFRNTDPIGATISQSKVLRGGSYKSNENVLRNAFRYDAEPGYRSAQMGLRLVKTVSE